MVSGAIRELASGPGTDTRQWTSYGIVEPDTAGQHSVRFNDENGSPLAHGVLVDVKLQPSGITVPCRVMSQCAGNGEGEWHPFVPGDEVMVLIPEGDERAGCAIIGRFNQSHDVFPTTVGGQDVTTNTFGFKRHIAPFIVEVGQGYVIRSFMTNAAFTIDNQGQVFITDGESNLLAMTPHAISLMTVGETNGFQVDLEKTITFVKSTTASLTLDDTNGSKWQSKGTLSISASGNPGLNNVATVQGNVQFMVGVLTMFGTLFAGLAGPVVGAELAALFNPAALPAIINGALALAGTPACSFTPYLGGITAGLSVPKVPGVNAGIGSAGFMTD